MNDTDKSKIGRPRGRRPQYKIEPSPYDLRRPMDVAPERIRKDPRIKDQRLTAFWVTVRGEHVGRVSMHEFDDRPGWFYQPESWDGTGRPTPFGDPLPKRKQAVEAVIDEWRARQQTRGAKQSTAA